MSGTHSPAEHLTSYERAVCYYTLPKVVTPVGYGLVAAYIVCLLEAVGLLLYGWIAGNEVLTRWGIVAVAAMIGFGVLAFLLRAFFNDLRERQLLKGGNILSDNDFDRGDVPDPLARNLLLCFSLRDEGGARAIKDNDGAVRYTVTPGPGRGTKTVTGTDGTVLSMRHARGLLGLGVFTGSAGTTTVSSGDHPVATIRRRISFSDPIAHIECIPPKGEPAIVKNRSLFLGARLIGRVYYVRGHVYLDVEREPFHDGILGFFASMA